MIQGKSQLSQKRKRGSAKPNPCLPFLIHENRMKQTIPQTRAFRLVPAIMLAIPLLQAHDAQAATSVWEVSRGDARLYLGGTIHVLRQSDYPLPEEFSQAYAASDEIYFEIDLNKAMAPAFQATILRIGSYSDGRSLQNVLSEDVHTRFYALAGKFGIPHGDLDHIKPSLSTAMLLLLELGNLGFDLPQGVEMHFLERANRDGLPQGALETLEFQANMIAEVGAGNEEAMIADFLEQIETIEDSTREVVSAWRKGDVGVIEKTMLKDMAAFPEDYEATITRRNRNWVPQIMAMLKDADVEFVLVGVGHMPGKDGLLELLRQQGATVRPLVLQNR